MTLYTVVSPIIHEPSQYSFLSILIEIPISNSTLYFYPFPFIPSSITLYPPLLISHSLPTLNSFCSPHWVSPKKNKHLVSYLSEKKPRWTSGSNATRWTIETWKSTIRDTTGEFTSIFEPSSLNLVVCSYLTIAKSRMHQLNTLQTSVSPFVLSCEGFQAKWIFDIQLHYTVEWQEDNATSSRIETSLYLNLDREVEGEMVSEHWSATRGFSNVRLVTPFVARTTTQPANVE